MKQIFPLWFICLVWFIAVGSIIRSLSHGIFVTVIIAAVIPLLTFVLFLLNTWFSDDDFAKYYRNTITAISIIFSLAVFCDFVNAEKSVAEFAGKHVFVSTSEDTDEYGRAYLSKDVHTETDSSSDRILLLVMEWGLLGVSFLAPAFTFLASNATMKYSFEKRARENKKFMDDVSKKFNL